jgi:hypothetical protein
VVVNSGAGPGCSAHPRRCWPPCVISGICPGPPSPRERPGRDECGAGAHRCTAAPHSSPSWRARGTGPAVPPGPPGHQAAVPLLPRVIGGSYLLPAVVRWRLASSKTAAAPSPACAGPRRVQNGNKPTSSSSSSDAAPTRLPRAAASQQPRRQTRAPGSPSRPRPRITWAEHRRASSSDPPPTRLPRASAGDGTRSGRGQAGQARRTRCEGSAGRAGKADEVRGGRGVRAAGAQGGRSSRGSRGSARRARKADEVRGGRGRPRGGHARRTKFAGVAGARAAGGQGGRTDGRADGLARGSWCRYLDHFRLTLSRLVRNMGV